MSVSCAHVIRVIRSCMGPHERRAYTKLDPGPSILSRRFRIVERGVSLMARRSPAHRRGEGGVTDEACYQIVGARSGALGDGDDGLEAALGVEPRHAEEP